MRRFTGWSVALAVAALAQVAHAAEKSNLKRENFTFGALTAPTEDAVKVQAARWLQQAGKYDRTQFDAIWADAEKSVLDRLSATFSMGDAEAAKLLAEARNPLTPAPTSLPALLGETKKTQFFRANLALAYAKDLVNRRVYEEALDTLNQFKVDQVVDPASFLFFKAVAEHGLLEKKAANESIARLLDDVPTAPERYRMVAALMHFDMLTWNERTELEKLGTIGRKMGKVERRLALERGGQKTQREQKDIVARLEELIKELENKANNDSDPNDGNCPSKGQGQAKGKGKGQGGTPGDSPQSSGPASDSGIGSAQGPGLINEKDARALAEQWGKLPPREREANIRDLTRNLDPRYREIIQEYFRKLTSEQARSSSD